MDISNFYLEIDPPNVRFWGKLDRAPRFSRRGIGVAGMQQRQRQYLVGLGIPFIKRDGIVFAGSAKCAPMVALPFRVISWVFGIFL